MGIPDEDEDSLEAFMDSLSRASPTDMRSLHAEAEAPLRLPETMRKLLVQSGLNMVLILEDDMKHGRRPSLFVDSVGFEQYRAKLSMARMRKRDREGGIPRLSVASIFVGQIPGTFYKLYASTLDTSQADAREFLKHWQYQTNIHELLKEYGNGA